MELFFDLVMVFALNRLVAAAVTGLEQPGLDASDVGRRWSSVGRTLLLFMPLFWSWTTTAFLTARVDPHTPRTQWAILTTGAALMVMGTSVPHVFDGGGALPFALAYVLSQITWFLIFATLLRKHPLSRIYWRVAIWFAVSGPLWIIGALAPGRGQLLLWSVAIVIDLASARLGWPVPRLGRGRASAWALAPHHLADRYKQLTLIALGETILAVGTTYASGPGRTGSYESVGLAVAFVTTVLLWRIYFHRAGFVLGEAIAAARDPAALGRFVSSTHTVMIFGIVMTAIGHELVQIHALERTYPAWLALILGGPACYLAGRAALERAVFSRVSLRRWIGIGVLLAAGIPLIEAPPLAAATTAAIVLYGVAAVDTLRAAHRPPEDPHPADRGANWSWWLHR
ncbi:low temperature requirement protein A [Micromonospora sp. WMMD1076]|uniref:low temperature requirement protein A n=1 Tax=Micromonospora TaxID=1873 RepID=UPI00249C3330|nr:low temperature requirement protein A [Micromonospora sp. WMMD1076]WFF04508.1 low temperature requirement protein A [Micromonospora sp. WMMD1076]